jgi:hypothetical protein
MIKNETWRPWVEMSSTIPFIRTKGRSKVYRELEVAREFSLGDKYGKDDLGASISLKVTWYANDRRDKNILLGIEREQNVVVDVVNLLMVIKEIFPEYKIEFSDPHSPAVPVADDSL